MITSLSCLVCGDFNEIMYTHKKVGGVPVEEHRMESFRNSLEMFGLFDIGYSGRWYTWERGNLPATNIREWLDRAVMNIDWLEKFPTTILWH